MIGQVRVPDETTETTQVKGLLDGVGLDNAVVTACRRPGRAESEGRGSAAHRRRRRREPDPGMDRRGPAPG